MSLPDLLSLISYCKSFFFLFKAVFISLLSGNGAYNIIYPFKNNSDFCFLVIFSFGLEMSSNELNIGPQKVRSPKHTWRMIFFLKTKSLMCLFSYLYTKIG